MPQTVWSGSIAFGLVNVPVKLSTATSEKTVRFNQINSETGNRVRQKRVDDKSGEEVPYEKIVKGKDVGGRFVTVTDDELASLAPQRSRVLAIERFVPLGQIDPLAFKASYWVAPADDAATTPYRLLLGAMKDTKAAAVGRIILRSKESPVVLRVARGALSCTLLHWADEITEPANVIQSLRGSREPTAAEASMAKSLVSQLTQDFDHDAFRDEHRERVLALIEAKAAGETLEAAPEAEEPAPAPDLMAALEASLASTRAAA